ncbi:glucosaminidase domain-containing protein [Cohnella luojiensis]|uniref:Uncharacterized protein n=1 Tax=Cohnella luojiensis TaxID=652876 RepID=A0A4Y8LTY0_9BACL|nr:glucosaminidase domain-containing protein [Cohnella luojiensis]TFE24868.1 hypothetical protein E2980_15095 [Cohnella luojiensis]
MESAALLSPTDIHTIRRYVHTKYAPLPGHRRAEIVADAIRRTLQQRLPDLPSEMKSPMIDKLISRCLLGEQRGIQPDDVLDLCAELDIEDVNMKEQSLGSILSWINERSPGRWSPEQLATRLDRRKPFSVALVQGLPASAEHDLINENKVARWFGIALKLFHRRVASIPIVALLLVVVLGAVGFAVLINNTESPGRQIESTPPVVVKPAEPLRDIGMPARLKYAEIDVRALKSYLNSRDSLLAEEPYFNAIVEAAREYDIHPLLLFAITGQEQGFVPKTGKDAKLIANNPFNVGHSWMEYNTDIHGSVGIASRLLVKLADSRPEGHDAFSWFNKTYAEDPLWSDGVRKIFNKLMSLPDQTAQKAE